MEVDQNLHQDEHHMGGFKMFAYHHHNQQQHNDDEYEEYQQKKTIKRACSSPSSLSLPSNRRRNAMANIFENVKAEDVLLLNLDFDIGVEESREIERRLMSEKDYVSALDQVAQLLPSQQIVLFKSRTMALIADELNNDLCELMQEKNNKMLKTN